MLKSPKKIEYEKRFFRQLSKLPIKIQQQTRARIAQFVIDENPEQLRDHALGGTFLGYRSINITGDVRALYYLRADGTIVAFAFIGTRSQLYG